MDTGTRYGERAIFPFRTGETIEEGFEKVCFYTHGPPKAFGTGQEFCRTSMRAFMDIHDIEVRPRPSRSSHKRRKAERNNGVFKNIVPRLENADMKASAETIVASESFMTNPFHGSKIMSAFRMAKGYSPYIIGIPRRMVKQELLDSHVQREATRAIEKVLRYRIPGVVDSEMLRKGAEV